jgi:CheY-like chemotaxis protein
VTAREAVISNVECTLLVEDAVAHLRHDVFNSLAAVRSAAYYIQRRVSGTEAWQSDPRIEQFFQLIAQQLDAAVARIGLDPKASLPHQRSARLVDGAECVRAGISALSARTDLQRVSLRIEAGRVRVDPEELALAVSASLGYLLDAVPAGHLALEASMVADGYQVCIEARPLAGAALTPDMGPAPRGLALARRVAIAASGRFGVERSAVLVRVTLAIPDAEEATETTRILIVDDEVAGRATLAALLELEGHEVRECGSLAQAKAALSSGDRFDAVLIDRQLPDGRGDSLAEPIQRALPKASLILITGEAVDAVPPGFHAAYQKGMNPAFLTELVGRLLQIERGD